MAGMLRCDHHLSVRICIQQFGRKKILSCLLVGIEGASYLCGIRLCRLEPSGRTSIPIALRFAGCSSLNLQPHCLNAKLNLATQRYRSPCDADNKQQLAPQCGCAKDALQSPRIAPLTTQSPVSLSCAMAGLAESPELASQIPD